nr:unnamed protein product [Callosobruchus chinensis]
MRRSYPPHISSKKQKKLSNINHNSQTMEEHASSERSTKQTEQIHKATKQKGRQSLCSQKQELQFPSDTKHSEPLKGYASSDIYNGEIAHSGINSINQGQTKHVYATRSLVQKEFPHEVLKSSRFYSPKSSHSKGSLKPTLKTEVDVASTSILPIHAPYRLSNSPGVKPMYRKTYGKKIDSANLNSFNHFDESISSPRNHVIDVPIENASNVTIEEPSEFNAWIIDDSDLVTDIRYVPSHFCLTIEDDQFGVHIEDFEGNIDTDRYNKNNVLGRDTSNFVISVTETKSIRSTMKQVEDICCSSKSCYTTESNVDFNDDENIMFGDVQIEIANTHYSPDNKNLSAAVDEKVILKNTNKMNSEKVTDSYVASNIKTSLMLNNQETNDSLFVKPSSRRNTILRSGILKMKNDNQLAVSLNESTIFRNEDNAEPEQQSSRIIQAAIPVLGNEGKHEHLNLTPSSGRLSRNSKLQSRVLGAEKNENPKLEIGKKCNSVDSSEIYEFVDTSTNIEKISSTSRENGKYGLMELFPSSTMSTNPLKSGLMRKQDLQSKISTCDSSNDNETSTSSNTSNLTDTSRDQLSQSIVASNGIMKSSLPVDHSITFQTKSNTYTRKSTLRSGSTGMNKNECLEVKNKTSSNDSDTSVPFFDATSSTKGSVECEQSRLFVALSSIKKTSLKLDENNSPQTSSLNLYTRKSTLRSRSLGMNHNEELEVRIVDTCCSSDTDSYVALDNNTTSNPNDGIKSKQLSRSFTTSTSSKKSPLPLQSDFSLHTPSLNEGRKSTLRSNIRRIDDLEAKFVNMCPRNDTDRSVTLVEVTTPNTTDTSLGPEHKDNGKDDSLFLSPSSRKCIKKSTPQSKVEPSNLNKHDRISTLRSRSLEVKKSYSDNDRERKILSKSLSHFDQSNSFPKENESLAKRSNINLNNKYGKLEDATILNSDKFETKKLMDKKILKVVVVPMENMTRAKNGYDNIQNIEIVPSSSLGDNKTAENNNLVEPDLTLNSMKNSLPSSKEKQNCNTDVTCTQNPKFTATDEEFVNHIGNSGVNQSLLCKNRRKKINHRASSDFISPRLKAKQLQQKGLISEDTSFAFYSTVDSVLAEIKVSQKQHKLNSQSKKQHAEVDERIKGHTLAPNVIKQQMLSVCVHDVITHIIGNVSRNERSGRKSLPLKQHQNSNCRVSSGSPNTQDSFGKLIEGHRELCKNCGTALLQNGSIGLEYGKSGLDSIANNQLVKQRDILIVEESEQKSVGNIALEILNESKDAEDTYADRSNNKKTSQLQELECNIETQKNSVKQKSSTRKRGSKTKALVVTQLNGESTSNIQDFSQEFETVQGIVTTVADTFSPTKREARSTISGESSVVRSEDSIVSTEQVSKGSEFCNDTHVIGNYSLKEEKGRATKSEIFTERLSNNGDAIEHLQAPEISSEIVDKIDKVSTKKKRNNCAMLPIGLSNDITAFKNQDLSKETGVKTEPLTNSALRTENIIPPRRGRSRKSEVNTGKLQECKVSTEKLKQKLVSPKERRFRVKKSSRTSNTVEIDRIIVTKELESYHIPEINNEVFKLRETSPKARMTRSRSQELAETNVESDSLITDPLVSQDNTEMEEDSNSHEQKLLQACKGEDLSAKGESSRHRKSEELREMRVKNIDLAGTNTLGGLENRLKSPKQPETPKNRRGRSEGKPKTAGTTVTTGSSVQEDKNTADSSSAQTENDFNSSIGVTDKILNEKSTSSGANPTLFEQNNKLISPKSNGKNNLNNREKQSVQISDIGTLSSKQEQDHRKLGKLSETQVENGNIIGINITNSLEDKLKSPKQPETPKGRRGRSETADSTLITQSSELESKSTGDLSRSQIENDLDSFIQVATDVYTGIPAGPDARLMLVEQKEELIKISGQGESFESNMASENKAKSVEKWVEEHRQLVGAESESTRHNSDNGMVSVTNEQQASKNKLKIDPRRSLTRGRKLVAMIQDNANNACAVQDIKDGNSRNSALEKSLLHPKSVINTVEASGDSVEYNAGIEEKSSLNRLLTRGSSSMLEQEKLVENNAPDENQIQQQDKALLLNQSEERCVTEIGNHGNTNRSKSRSRRRSSSMLFEGGKSKEDIFKDVRGCKGDPTDSDESQMGAQTDGDEEMMEHSPEKHCRPVTSLRHRKKSRKHRSISWSARKSRGRSKCPSEGGKFYLQSFKFYNICFQGLYLLVPFFTDMSSYKHGDLIWAQIGSHPYWPCMVTYAPDTKEVKRTCFVGRGIRTIYHVQFFGDKGRRAWINVTRTMPFNSSNDLKATIDRLEAEEGGYNLFYKPFMLKSNRAAVNQRLQVAANEAESLKSKTIEDKEKFFEDVIKKLKEREVARTSQTSAVRSATDKSGTRRSVRIESMEGAIETTQGGEEERERDKEVDRKDTPIAPKIVKPPLVIPPLEELYSIEAQKALFKRNNLFKGVSRDKVCHFCLEPGDVLRCSAKCSGIYHLECSLLVMNNKIGSKRQASLKYSPSIKSEDGERSERGEVEDHVQIVTVQSSIYNTPPGKNFPPDFGNLTLAEQIDYKMNEVMRKFESKNIYANDSQSASSDSNSSDKKAEVVIRHVAADSVIAEYVAKLKKPSKNNVAVKLFAKTEEGSNNGSFKIPIKRHVTADDISFEMLPTDSKNFKCGFCLRDTEPNCFVCHESISPRGSQVRQKCSLYHCGRFFHPCCLKMWPQTQWSIIQLSDRFVCPQHVCTKILSTSQIVCPGHKKKSNSLCINTTWCFLCSEGGNLICCENCPTSVHPECLPVSLTDDGKFICEDCESGRLPLYDEIVWVKLGHFRFFGTYNYYWVNRGRSFLFQDGDTGDGNNKVKKLDKEFKKAVEEATLAHKLKQEFKNTQQVESLNSQKPPPYIKIKVNKPVGNVRQLDLDLSNTTPCNCDPNQKNPCGPDSDCLNRLLMTECNPEVAYKTQARGWGLKTLMHIKKGQFVIEYVGEIIDTEEYQRRIQKMHEQKEENYYFLTIDNQRMLDAGPKGNLARFMNHCCQPNCETQKWTVNGETRVGLFATEDIPAETELTFNYNLECIGKEKKVCRCGAPNCSGFIGVKAKQRVYRKKKKKLAKPVVSQPCFICSRTDDVITCNNKMCNKAYHTKCLKLDINNFDASRFVCPWHNCDICSKRTIRCCLKCIRSYCPQHSDGRIRHDGTAGYVCYKHDSIRRAMGKTSRIGLASMSMSVLFITVTINFYYIYLELEEQEIWQCIDEAIFFSTSMIMCLSVLSLFIKVCIFDNFNPLIDLIVFIYLMMWLLSCVAVITSDYMHYWFNLSLVIAGYIFLTIFTMCITGCYMDHKYRMEQAKLYVDTKIVTQAGRPNCYRIPLSGATTSKASVYV